MRQLQRVHGRGLHAPGGARADPRLPARHRGRGRTTIGEEKLRALRENALFFRRGLEDLGLEVLGEHPSPVMPVMLYQPHKIGDFSRLAFNRKLAVVAGAPATPVTYPRVRFCVSAAHSKSDLADALRAIDEIAEEMQIKFKINLPARNALFGNRTGSLADQEAKEHEARSRRVSEARGVGTPRSPPRAVGRDELERFAPLHPRGKALGDDLGETAGCTRARTGRRIRTSPRASPRRRGDVRDGDGVFSGRVGADVGPDDAGGVREHGGDARSGFVLPPRVLRHVPPHPDLERSIAEFLGAQEAVLYSFGACTVSSVIPALGHKSDVAVVDRGVGHGILAGLRLAKMDVRWYDHCDADDAARVFANLEAEDGVTSARLARPGRRRWLITEGCFAGTGRVAPLPELLHLKETHHARMILDESISFGAMGPTGRGVTEHFGLETSRVDVISASLENAGASVGGFCAGDTGVVAYQRLMGSGYVFSASLPPYLATAAAHAVRASPRAEARWSAQAARAGLRDARSPATSGLTTDADELAVVPLRSPSAPPRGRERAPRGRRARARAEGVGVCVARVNPLVPRSRTRAGCVVASRRACRKTLQRRSRVRGGGRNALPAHALEAGVERARRRQSPPATPNRDRSVLGPRGATSPPSAPAKRRRASTLDGTIASTPRCPPRNVSNEPPKPAERPPAQKRPAAAARRAPCPELRQARTDERALLLLADRGRRHGRSAARARRACGATATPGRSPCLCWWCSCTCTICSGGTS